MEIAIADAVAVEPEGSRDLTAPVLAAMRAYQHLETTDHVRVALAVAATADLDGDPLWLHLIGNPSSGKTEDVAMLADVAVSVDEITVAGLLGGPARAIRVARSDS